MSFGFGIGDAIAIIDKCIRIYEKSQDAPKTIIKVKNRLKSEQNYLGSVERHGDLLGRNCQATHISQLVDTIKHARKQIELVFERYERDARVNITKFFYSMGSSTAQLKEHLDCIQYNRELLSDYVALSLLNEAKAKSPPTNKPQLVDKPKQRQRINILFVDNNNRGRSVIAQAYAQLLTEWSRQASNNWPVEKIDSAGLLLDESKVILELQNIQNWSTRTGIETPKPNVISTAFNSVDVPLPAEQVTRMRKIAAKRHPHGLSTDTFRKYDYIFVFSFKAEDRLVKLKEAVRDRFGQERVASDRGRIVCLGEYIKSCDLREILDPDENPTDDSPRKMWRKTAKLVRESFTEWLREEMDWNAPSY